MIHFQKSRLSIAALLLALPLGLSSMTETGFAAKTIIFHKNKAAPVKEEPKPDLEFEDPEILEIQKKRNIALAASVVAETPRQQTPSFFAEQELLYARLPNLNGDDEASNAARPMQGETFESVAYPHKAPENFAIDRSNIMETRRKSLKISSRIWGKAWHHHQRVPGILINAAISSHHISAEPRGATEILRRPKVTSSALAYIPIDEGGPAVEAVFYMYANLPEQGMYVAITPYSEDLLSNAGLVMQTVQVMGKPQGARERAIAKSIFAHIEQMTSIEKPHIKKLGAQEVIFRFPETRKGVPRGVLVSFEGGATEEVTNKRDTFLDNSPVTEITEIADHQGQVAIRFNLAYEAD